MEATKSNDLSILLKVADVARELQIGQQMVRKLIATGDLPSCHIGRHIRVKRVELDKWVAKQK